MSDVHYFSNGTEGRRWMAAWCDQCLHDHQFRLGHGTGCEILGDMYLHRFRPELIDNGFEAGGPEKWWTCIEFKPYGYRKPGPPQPKPVPPGQGVLTFDELVKANA